MTSFSGETKLEICRSKQLKGRGNFGLALGMLLYGGRFDEDEISLYTEHQVVAQKYAEVLCGETSLRGSVQVQQVLRPGRPPMYTARVDQAAMRMRLRKKFPNEKTFCPDQLPEGEYKGFLTGAYLVCGNVWAPEKGYRGEFRTGNRLLAKGLAWVLGQTLYPPKETIRRNAYLLYYTDSGHVEDLLTYLGAVKSSLRLMDVKILRDIRNRANRRTNCDTANISKTVDTALRQCERLARLRESPLWDGLTEDSREIALVRLENPQASLRELSALLPGHPSRSTLSRRLNQLLAMVEQ